MQHCLMQKPSIHPPFQFQLFKKIFLLCRVNTSDTDIIKTVNKRKVEKDSNQYKVQNDADLELFQKFKIKHPNISIGRTTFKKIKPFFIRPCKSADLQTCCCATRVNFRNTVEALIGISKQFNSVYGNVHPDDDTVPAFNSYRSFMGFIYRDYHRDEFGLLVQKCESGECGNWQVIS